MPFFFRHSSRWSVVIVLGCTTILSYGTTQYLFGVLEVPLATAFSWSRGEISGVYALSLLVAGILGVPVGYLIDRFGARVLLTVGSTLAGCALIGLSQISGLWQFYLYWSGGLGIAMALILYPVTFTIVTASFEDERAKAFAILTLVGGLASPVFIPLTSWLIPQIGWRSTLLWYGVLHLTIAGPLHVWFIRHVPDQQRSQKMALPTSPLASEAPTEVFFTARQALSGVRFWVLTGAYAFVLLGSSVISAHQIAYLASRGYSSLLVASVAGALGLASLPGRFFLNLLSQRILSQTLLIITLTVQAGGTLVLILSSDARWLLLYVAFYGTAFGVFSPLRALVMADHFGKRAYGAITAIQGVPLAICQSASPLIAGWLYDRLHRYDLAFWLCAACFLIGALLILGLPPPGSAYTEHSRRQ